MSLHFRVAAWKWIPKKIPLETSGGFPPELEALISVNHRRGCATMPNRSVNLLHMTRESTKMLVADKDMDQNLLLVGCRASA
jgi:hypothetical protein